MTYTNSFHTISPTSQLGITLTASRNANLNSMQIAHPDLASLIFEHDLLKDGVLGRNSEGMLGIISSSPEGKLFHPLTDYQTIENLQRVIPPLFQHFDNVLLLGTGIGEFLSLTQDFLLNSTMSKATEKKFFFVEPDTDFFQAALHFFDFTPLWKQQATEVYIGPLWYERLQSRLRDGSFSGQTLLAVHPTVADKLIQMELKELLGEISIKPITVWDIQSTHQGAKKEIVPEGWQTVILGPNSDQNHRSTFLKNIESIKKYYPYAHLHEKIVNLESLRISVRKDKSGTTAFSTENGEHLSLSFNDHELQTIKNRLRENYRVENTYLILGTGDEMLVKTVLEETVFRGQWSGFEQVVYLVEPHTELFVFFLHSLDIADYIEKHRIRIFIGSTALLDFMNNLKSEVYARIPNQFLAARYYQDSGALKKIQTDISSLEQEILSESEATIAQLTGHYNALPISFWRDRFKEDNTLTIVGISTRMSSFIQYCARDLIDGFRKLGHNAKLLIEPDGTSCLRISEVVKSIFELKPDLVFVIGHVRDEFPWLPKRLPFICWIQDMLPCITDYRGYVIQQFDFTYILTQSWEAHLRLNLTFSQGELHELPLACNDLVFHKINHIEKFYDISFAAHLADFNTTFSPLDDNDKSFPFNKLEQQIICEEKLKEEHVTIIYKALKSALDTLNLEQLTAIVTSKRKQDNVDFITDLIKGNSLSVNSSLVNYLLSVHSRFNLHTINLIKSIPMILLAGHGYKISIWGNNWHRIKKLSPFSRGIALNENLNLIQNQSKICLNNSGGISFHMRAVEILASGTFMLSRRIINDGMSITDYFIEGDEIILFDSERDLLEKVDYYLNNEDEREEIAQRAMDRAVRQYNYSTTAKRLIRDVRNRIMNL